MSDIAKKKLEFLVKLVYVLVIMGIVYVVFEHVLGLIFPFVAALILVSVFSPLMRKVQKHLWINQKVAAVVIMALIYVLVCILIVWIIIGLVYLIQQMLTILPGYYAVYIEPAIKSLIARIQLLVAGLPEVLELNFTDIQNTLISNLSGMAASISQQGISLISKFTGSLPLFIMNLIFTIMLSFFISMQYEQVIQFLSRQIPKKAREVINEMLLTLKSSVFKYLKAILMLMTITFVEISVGLLFLRVPGAFGVALIIAIFDALPVFGTGAIMIPWILVDLLQGNFEQALGLAIVYAIVTIVRNIIEPKIVGDQLGLNPIVSLVSIYLGFRLFGVLGMISFPILAQIALTLHHNGSIRLYHEEQVTPYSTTEALPTEEPNTNPK